MASPIATGILEHLRITALAELWRAMELRRTDGLDYVAEVQAYVDQIDRGLAELKAGCGATEPGECVCPCHLLGD